MESEKASRRFEIVRMDGPKVVIDAEGIKTRGLMGCISIAGSFEGPKHIAFMTHRGARDFIENLTDVVIIAEKHGLKNLSGSLFIFRKAQSIMPKDSYMVDSRRYKYQDVVATIRKALQYTFTKASIIEVEYGDGAGAGTGYAALDLKNKRYETDIEKGTF